MPLRRVPPLQIYIVRILWMVPVYSICTLASLYLWVWGMEPYTYIPDAGRQIYEAYTLYNLFSFMIAFLEMESGLPAGKLLAATHPTVSFVTHAPPFSLRFGGRYGVCGVCGEEVDPLEAITNAGSAHDDNSNDDDDDNDESRPSAGGGGGQRKFLGRAHRVDILEPWRMGDEFVDRCRKGVLFYVTVSCS